jgi:hypothetical protein
MAVSSDVRDILEIETKPENEFVTKEALMSDNKKVGKFIQIVFTKFICCHCQLR